MKHLNIKTVGCFETLLNNRLLLKGIIQIVQSPMDVIETIDDIWKQSMGDGCLIFKN